MLTSRIHLMNVNYWEIYLEFLMTLSLKKITFWFFQNAKQLKTESLLPLLAYLLIFMLSKYVSINFHVHVYVLRKKGKNKRNFQLISWC